MKEKYRHRFTNLIISVLAIVLMWAGWAVARFVVDDTYVVPDIGETVAEFFSLLASSAFWSAFGMTLLRSVWAWFISLVFAALLATLSATFRGARSFIAPFIAVFRTVPTMAITLMLLIWTSPRVAPIIVSMLMVFPLSYAQMMAAFDGIDRELVEMASVYHVPFFERLFKIYIPQILPPVLSQIGANLALTLKVMISAEVLCSTFNSLGGLIYQSNVNLDTARMFALTVCALAIGGILEWALSKLTHITDKWTEKSSEKNRVGVYRASGVPRCRGLGRRKVFFYGGTRRALVVKRRRRGRRSGGAADD